MGDYGSAMDTDKRVLPPIPFVYCFGLQNLRRHIAIKNKWYRGRHTCPLFQLRYFTQKFLDEIVPHSNKVPICYAIDWRPPNRVSFHALSRVCTKMSSD